MEAPVTNPLAGILNTPYLSRLRRNHGLEHATLTVLSRSYPGVRLTGHSDTAGFWLIGNVSSEAVGSAVQEALARLKAGERNLAVHPNCGTNFVTSGMLSALAAFIAFLGVGRRFRDRLERLPLAAALSVLALILANPLGMALQREVTTSGAPGSLVVVRIESRRRGRWMSHRVITRG
jgi:hypothetical protein